MTSRIKFPAILTLVFFGSPILASPVISEFVAINDSSLQDEDGQFSDWIEIHNPDEGSANLAGWHLTDDPDDLSKWTFPEVSILPGEFLIVFASNKDRDLPAGELHTNFKLSGGGEFLALVMPDGVTRSTNFAPYPQQIADVGYGMKFVDLQAEVTSSGYLSNPSPGAINPDSGADLGPLIRTVVHTPPTPAAADPITVSASITETLNPVASASLVYRVNFESETTIPMNSEGSGNFSAIVPGEVSAPGDMIRWRITATDDAGGSASHPLSADPNSSPRYLGTVIADGAIASELPILHWFVESPSRAETGTGTRSSVSFAGEFYDNVFVRIRGDTARIWPKKSFKFDFNDGHHFRFNPDLPKVSEINVNTTYTDKSYSRTILAYQTFRDAGSPYSISFPTRVERNGEFYSVAMFVEQTDRDYLRRNGLDDEGVLYKAKANSIAGLSSFARPATSGIEKKNRKEENFEDLQSLIDNLRLNGDELDHYLFDNIDLPAVVNNLATNIVIQNIDRTVKNFYLYRDTEGSGEWMFLPWDVDLSFGPNALNTNAVVFSEDRGNNSSHPFLGSDGKPYATLWNGLIDAVISRPATREMFLRRLGTLRDRFLNSTYYEDRLDELVADLNADVLLDRSKWRTSAHFGGRTLSLQGETDRIRNEYLPGRRSHLFLTHGGIGGSGAVLVPEDSPVTAMVPQNNSLGDSWTLREFDDSTWISGMDAVGYERSASGNYTPLLGLDLLSDSLPADQGIDRDGDNLNDNNSCYLRYEFYLLDINAIEHLKLRVKYDDGFVAYLNGTRIVSRNDPMPLVWNSEATAQNPDGEAVEFEDIDVSTFKTELVSGKNILAIQAMNRGSNSSDMIFSTTLLDESFGSGTGVGIPGPQPLAPMIQFGSIDPNPASGNQDEEFIELNNQNASAIDVSGWQVTGGVEMTLKPGTVIPAGGSLYLSPDVSVFRERIISPRRGEGKFVQGSYTGHLSNFGEMLVLTDQEDTVIATTSTDSAPTDAQRYLSLTEFHYHPAGDPGEEFIELANLSDSITLDLNGVRMTSGVDFDFSGSLAPGARILVVRNRAAFDAKYGAGLPVVGEFANSTSLNNDGETIKIEDATGSTVVEFTYNDKAPWPIVADGSGPSLVLNRPTSQANPNLSENWRLGPGTGGNPGFTDSRVFTGDPDADLNGNGLPDLVDHALFENSVPVSSLDATSARFKFVRDPSADDVLPSIEISTDLETWSAGAGLFELVQSEDLAEGGRIMTHEAPQASIPRPKFFVRLKVELLSN